MNSLPLAPGTAQNGVYAALLLSADGIMTSACSATAQANAMKYAASHDAWCQGLPAVGTNARAIARCARVREALGMAANHDFSVPVHQLDVLEYLPSKIVAGYGSCRKPERVEFVDTLAVNYLGMDTSLMHDYRLLLVSADRHYHGYNLGNVRYPGFEQAKHGVPCHHEQREPAARASASATASAVQSQDEVASEAAVPASPHDCVLCTLGTCEMVWPKCPDAAPTRGSWTCNICTQINEPGHLMCACGTLRVSEDAWRAAMEKQKQPPDSDLAPQPPADQEDPSQGSMELQESTTQESTKVAPSPPEAPAVQTQQQQDLRAHRDRCMQSDCPCRDEATNERVVRVRVTMGQLRDTAAQRGASRSNPTIQVGVRDERPAHGLPPGERGASTSKRQRQRQRAIGGNLPLSNSQRANLQVAHYDPASLGQGEFGREVLTDEQRRSRKKNQNKKKRKRMRRDEGRNLLLEVHGVQGGAQLQLCGSVRGPATLVPDQTGLRQLRYLLGEARGLERIRRSQRDGMAQTVLAVRRAQRAFVVAFALEMPRFLQMLQNMDSRLKNVGVPLLTIDDAPGRRGTLFDENLAVAEQLFLAAANKGDQMSKALLQLQDRARIGGLVITDKNANMALYEEYDVDAVDNAGDGTGSSAEGVVDEDVDDACSRAARVAAVDSFLGAEQVARGDKSPDALCDALPGWNEMFEDSQCSVFSFSLRRNAELPYNESAARSFGPGTDWHRWCKGPADGGERDIADLTLRNDMLLVVEVPVGGKWHSEVVQGAACLRTTPHQQGNIEAGKAAVRAAFIAGMHVVLLPYKDGAECSLGDIHPIFRRDVVVNQMDMGNPPIDMKDVQAFVAHLLKVRACPLRGTLMVQVFLSATHPFGFDARNWRMCGPCFGSLPFHLRESMARAFVALARLAQLGDGTVEGKGRGNSHAAALCAVLPLEAMLEDGLVDGVWGLLEGMSVALSGPLGELSAADVCEITARGFKCHMDVSNDSRKGFDKTVVISFTGVLGADGEVRRFSAIGYTRHVMGRYWQKSREGDAPLSSFTIKRPRRSGVPGGRRGKLALAARAPRASRARPRAPANSLRHVADASGDFAAQLGEVTIAWANASGRWGMEGFTGVLPPPGQGMVTWLSYAKEKQMAFTHAHRSQVDVVVRRMQKRFPHTLPTEAVLTACLQSFMLMWICASRSNGGGCECKGKCDCGTDNWLGRGTCMVYDVSVAIAAMSDADYDDVFNRDFHHVMAWAQLCAAKHHTPAHTAAHRSLHQHHHRHLHLHQRHVDCYQNDGKRRFTKGVFRKNSEGVLVQVETHIRVGERQTRGTREVCRVLLRAVQRNNGPLSIGTLFNATALVPRYKMPYLGDTSALPYVTLLCKLGLVKMDVAFLPPTITQRSAGAVLWAMKTGEQWSGTIEREKKYKRGPKAGSSRIVTQLAKPSAQAQKAFKLALLQAQKYVKDKYDVVYHALVYENVACKVNNMYMKDYVELVMDFGDFGDDAAAVGADAGASARASACASASGDDGAAGARAAGSTQRAQAFAPPVGCGGTTGLLEQQPDEPEGPPAGRGRRARAPGAVKRRNLGAGKHRMGKRPATGSTKQAAQAPLEARVQRQLDDFEAEEGEGAGSEDSDGGRSASEAEDTGSADADEGVHRSWLGEELYVSDDEHENEFGHESEHDSLHESENDDDDSDDLADAQDTPLMQRLGVREGEPVFVESRGGRKDTGVVEEMHWDPQQRRVMVYVDFADGEKWAPSPLEFVTPQGWRSQHME